jgi:predicted dehydrogenase
MEALHIGLIGVGGIAGTHLQAYAHIPEMVALTAICDLRGEAAQQRTEAMGIRAVYTDVSQMLKEAPIDAVDICTTPNSHAGLALTAIEMGKHVLIEKPMACSLQQCRAIVQAAQMQRVTLMVGQNQRYDPTYQGVRQAIEAGELGTIRAFRFDATQNLPAFANSGHWYYDGKLAGGGVVISIFTPVVPYQEVVPAMDSYLNEIIHFVQ